jgi:hypothetical protein
MPAAFKLRHRSVFILLLTAACGGSEKEPNTSMTADSAGVTMHSYLQRIPFQ